MAMVGWVGVGMEVVVDCRHIGQSQEFVACQELREHFSSAK